MIWIEAIVGLLVFASGILVFTSALGVWRLPDFFLRMHAPAIASSLAAWFVAFASIARFWADEGGFALRVLVITVLLSITVPLTAMLLSRAALFRRRSAGGRSRVPRAIGR